MSKIDWNKYEKGLNDIFGSTSFKFLKKMGFAVIPDDEGDYDTCLDSIHKVWNTYIASEKALELMDTANISSDELIWCIEQNNYNYFQI